MTSTKTFRMMTLCLITNCFSRRIASSFVLSRPQLHQRGAVAQSFFHATPARKRRREGQAQKGSSPTTQQLEWETFEFSDNPKWDTRFENDNNAPRFAEASTEEELKELYINEEAQDKETAIQLKEQNEAWQRLDPALVAKATAVLRPYVKDERIERIETVLKKRTKHTRFLFENPANPSNVWACLRTLDAFGIQHVDMVVQSGMYKGKAALSQKRGMRTAMGSAQWLTLHNHASTADAIEALRKQHNNNIVIYASDLSPTSQDIRAIDWDDHTKQQEYLAKQLQSTATTENHNADTTKSWTDDNPAICIVMGNEERGISDEMKQLADFTFTLPMVGFAESFNLSVATAITLAHLSASSSVEGKGPLRIGDLPQHQYDCLILKGFMNSVAQKRIIPALLKKEGIKLPEEIMRLL